MGAGRASLSRVIKVSIFFIHVLPNRLFINLFKFSQRNLERLRRYLITQHIIKLVVHFKDKINFV